MADPPGGVSGLLVRSYKGKEADQLVTRIDPGAVSLVAELRTHECQAAEELGRWKTGVEERKVIDASLAAITCRKPSTSLRAMVRLPKYSPSMARPRTGNRGWMA
jgi:hypothetical protein